jgi:hypothetical protein
MTRLRRFRVYGAGPLHLLASLAGFAIAGAAVVGWFQRPRDVATVLEWFAAAIVLHDLVALPLYSLLDRIAFGRRRRRDADAARRSARRVTARRLVNPKPYLRIPAILSGLLLAVFFPVIFGFGTPTELSATGIVESGYLVRWLLATGVIFTVSGMAYVTAVARSDARPGSEDQRPHPAAPEPHPGAPEPDPTGPGPDLVVPGPDPPVPEPHPAAPEAHPAAPEPHPGAPDPDLTGPGPDLVVPDPDPPVPDPGT